MSWDGQSALEELGLLIDESRLLAGHQRYSEAHARWLLKTGTFLAEVFGPDSSFHGSFHSLTWGLRGKRIVDGWKDINAEMSRLNQEGYLRDLGIARGILEAARDNLRRHGIEEVFQGATGSAGSSAAIKVLNLVERKLRKLIREMPEKEVTIQDAVENLLIGADVEYSRETDSIEYSSKTYRPDFTVKRIDLALEVKLCARDGREKEIIGEINDDILAYGTAYTNLMFIVYDCGFIRDVDRFAGQFDRDNVVVRVVKH